MEEALFRHLLLQAVGTNIESPPPSSSLAEERRLRSILLVRRRAIPDARSV